MAKVYLGLGGNLGDVKQTLKDATVCLAQHPHFQITARSCFYESAPIDSSGDNFINCVIAAQTALPPLALLRLCQSVEHEFGRERPFRNAPRTLDIDILLYDDLQDEDPELTIPHPRMTERLFVLTPLLEIYPEATHPKLGALKNFTSALSTQKISRMMGCQCPKMSGF